eukprot:CAMPEP_0198520130 /NCGR_PEP_ID=MMETSP1462-20131121/20138_1 /TAXON_ID=1333877 /ORGANISM="Brandtodinium nutriculum, Strain RCC3387" /LENGTH=181 /DNA_ID=CAMNT_0044249755 /DNA_START=133 /DNA_END=675 /DNA_ORIENTATION=-
MAAVTLSAGDAICAPLSSHPALAYGEDLADMLLLMFVFCLGWMVFNRLAWTVCPYTRFARTDTAVPWSPCAADAPTPCQLGLDEDGEGDERDGEEFVGKGGVALDPTEPQPDRRASAPAGHCHAAPGGLPEAAAAAVAPARPCSDDDFSALIASMALGAPVTAPPPLSDCCADFADCHLGS